MTLTVITVEEYNAFLREQTDIGDIEAKYSQLLRELHQLAEEQKQLSAQSEALQKQLAAAKSEEQRAALQKTFDELTAKQQQLNQQIQAMAETMENFVRDQPLYDIEAELKDVLAEKAQEIRESVKANEEALQQLAEKPPADAANSKPGRSQAKLYPRSIAAGDRPFSAQSSVRSGPLSETLRWLRDHRRAAGQRDGERAADHGVDESAERHGTEQGEGNRRGRDGSAGQAGRGAKHGTGEPRVDRRAGRGRDRTIQRDRGSVLQGDL